MEKENAVAIAASKDGGGSEEATVIAAPGATVEQALGVQAPVVQANDGASEAAGDGNLPAGWDPYRVVPYVRPANPFDTNLVDAWKEVADSDVGSDDEDFDTKARQVLRRLKTGEYDKNFDFERNIFKCPFCKRNLSGKDFYAVVNHAESTSSSRPNVGMTENVNAFMANHKALGIHLRALQQVAIMEGRMQAPNPRPPKVKGLGSKKWRKRQREEEAARGL